MAATGTPTPNIGLRIPLGTDPASVDDINYNSNLIDTKLGAVGNDSVQDQIDDLNSNIGNVESIDRLLSLTTVNSSSLSEKSLSYNWNNYKMLVIVLASNADVILATTMIPTEMITQYITDFYVSYTSDSQTVVYTKFSTSAVGKVNVWTNNTSAKKIAIYGAMRKN